MLLTIVRITHDDARWRLARVVSLVAGERIVLRSLARRLARRLAKSPVDLE